MESHNIEFVKKPHDIDDYDGFKFLRKKQCPEYKAIQEEKQARAPFYIINHHCQCPLCSRIRALDVLALKEVSKKADIEKIKAKYYEVGTALMDKYETYTTPEEQENYVNFCIHYEQNKSDLDACNKNLIQANKEIKLKNEEIITLTERQKELNEKLKENLLAQEILEKDKKTLKTKLEELTKDLKKLEADKELKFNDLNKKSAELKKLQSELEAKEKEYNLLKNLNDEQFAELEKFKKDLKYYEYIVQLLEKKINKQTEEINAKKAKQQALETKIEELSDLNKKLTDKNQKLNKDLDYAKNNLTKKEEEIEKLKTEKQKLEQEKQNQQQNQNTIKEKQEEIDRLKEQLKTIKKETESAKKELAGKLAGIFKNNNDEDDKNEDEYDEDEDEYDEDEYDEDEYDEDEDEYDEDEDENIKNTALSVKSIFKALFLLITFFVATTSTNDSLDLTNKTKVFKAHEVNPYFPYTQQEYTDNPANFQFKGLSLISFNEPVNESIINEFKNDFSKHLNNLTIFNSNSNSSALETYHAANVANDTNIKITLNKTVLSNVFNNTIPNNLTVLEKTSNQFQCNGTTYQLYLTHFIEKPNKIVRQSQIQKIVSTKKYNQVVQNLNVKIENTRKDLYEKTNKLKQNIKDIYKKALKQSNEQSVEFPENNDKQIALAEDLLQQALDAYIELQTAGQNYVAYVKNVKKYQAKFEMYKKALDTFNINKQTILKTYQSFEDENNQKVKNIYLYSHAKHSLLAIKENFESLKKIHIDALNHTSLYSHLTNEQFNNFITDTKHELQDLPVITYAQNYEYDDPIQSWFEYLARLSITMATTATGVVNVGVAGATGGASLFVGTAVHGAAHATGKFIGNWMFENDEATRNFQKLLKYSMMDINYKHTDILEMLELDTSYTMLQRQFAQSIYKMYEFKNKKMELSKKILSFLNTQQEFATQEELQVLNQLTNQISLYNDVLNTDYNTIFAIKKQVQEHPTIAFIKDRLDNFKKEFQQRFPNNEDVLRHIHTVIQDPTNYRFNDGKLSTYIEDKLVPLANLNENNNPEITQDLNDFFDYLFIPEFFQFLPVDLQQNEKDLLKNMMLLRDFSFKFENSKFTFTNNDNEEVTFQSPELNKRLLNQNKLLTFVQDATSGAVSHMIGLGATNVLQTTTTTLIPGYTKTISERMLKTFATRSTDLEMHLIQNLETNLGIEEVANYVAQADNASRHLIEAIKTYAPNLLQNGDVLPERVVEKMVDVVKEVVVPATEQTKDTVAAAQLITFFESFGGDQINEYQKSMLEYFSNKVESSDNDPPTGGSVLNVDEFQRSGILHGPAVNMKTNPQSEIYKQLSQEDGSLLGQIGLGGGQHSFKKLLLLLASFKYASMKKRAKYKNAIKQHIKKSKHYIKNKQDHETYNKIKSYYFKLF